MDAAEGFVTSELNGYVTASNNALFVSLSLKFLERIIQQALQNLSTKAKFLSDDVFMTSVYGVHEINYDDKEIVFNNILSKKYIKFEEAFDAGYLLGNKSSKIFTDPVDELFGIKFNARLASVKFSEPTIDTYTDVLLIIDKFEPRTYTQSRIENDTRNFAAGIKLEFADREFFFIYNFTLDKIYYVDYTNKTVSDDITKLSSLHLYVDPEKSNPTIIKRVLRFDSVKEYYIKARGLGIKVDNDLKIRPYVVYPLLNGEAFISEEKAYDNKKNVFVPNIGYNVRNNALKTDWGVNNNIVKEVIRGIYQFNDTEVEKAILKDGKLTITYSNNGETKTIPITITNEGTYTYYDVFDKRNTIKTKLGIANFTNSIGSLWSNGEIVVDINIIRMYIVNNTFNLLGDAFYMADNDIAVFITDEKITTIDRSYIPTNHFYPVTYSFESWLGDEYYGEIEVKNIIPDSEDGYIAVGKIHNDKRSEITIERDLSKYINICLKT